MQLEIPRTGDAKRAAPKGGPLTRLADWTGD